MDAAAVAKAVDGVDVVIHLAAMIPPGADEQPDLARQTNVDGTAYVVGSCQLTYREYLTRLFGRHGRRAAAR